MILSVRTFVFALLAIAAAAPRAWAADPVEVFVDARDPAFVVVQGVAADAGPQARAEMEGYATLQGVKLVAWNAFRQDPQAVLGPYILKNEYPGSAVVISTVALVKAYPGRPFAITWNGGLAVSFHDYQHAVGTYQAYQEDADAYESSRPTDPKDDPLDPAHHLTALLSQ